MAKMRKRVFSMLLVIIMIVSMVPAVAVAEDETTSETTVESIPGGTNEITVTVSTSGNVQTTTTTESWESSSTPAVEPSTESNGSVTTGTATSETSGSSTHTVTETDGNGATRVDIETNGSESTTTTTELTNTKTDKNVVVDETPETTTDAEFVPDESAEPTDTNNNNGTWEEGKTEEGTFKPTAPLPDPVGSGPVPGVIDGNFLDGDKNNVDIWMEYKGETEVETKVEHQLDLDSKTYSVDILPKEISEQIKSKDAELDAGKTVTLEDGREVTKTVVDNKVTYIVKTTVKVPEEDISEEEKKAQDKAQLEQNKGEDEVTKVGKTYYDYHDTSIDETFKSVPTPEGAEVTTSTDENGNVTQFETVKDAEGKVVKEIERKPVYVEVTDKDGNKSTKLAYDVIETTYTPYTPENGVVGENETPVSGHKELPKTLPAPDAVTKNGETTSVSFESVLDESGKHLGYKAITTVTDKDGNTLSSSENVINEDSYSYVAKKSGGLTTTVTVSKLLDSNGNHIGYTTSTVVTDKDGNTVSSRSDSIEQAVYSDGTALETKYGQTVVSTKKTQVLSAEEKQDLELKNSSYIEQSYYQDITQEIYQMVETKDGLYLVYQGHLYEVTSTIKPGAESFVSSSTTVDFSKFNSSDDIYMGGTNTTVNDRDGDTGKLWEHAGNGLYSDFLVYDSNVLANSEAGVHYPRHYKLQDKNGNEIYAYCIELGAEIFHGFDYSQNVFDKGAANNGNKDFEGYEGTINNIRSIATNGYWGTESGIGSLQAVKDLMIRNGLGQHAAILTDGMALTATQVAFWEYGKNTVGDGVGTLTGNTHFNYTYDGDTGVFKITNHDNSAVSEAEKEAIYALRNLLVSLSKNEQQGQAEIIDKEDVKGAGVVLKDYKGQNSNGEHIYNTDVQFGLDVSTSSLNGDLVVKVIVNGEVVGQARLAGDDKHSVFDGVWKTIYPDSQGVYTIKDVVLTEGVPITINLDGVQHLDDGVYMLHCSQQDGSEYDAQDFVSLSKQEVDVELYMNLKFTVKEDPNYNKYTQKWTEEKVDRVNYSREDTGVRALKGTEESTANSAKVIGYTTTITTQTKTVKEHSEWSSKSNYGIVDPPLMPLNGDDIVIEEEPVPLAKAPGTGEYTWLLLAVFVLSGCSLLALNVKKRKEE